MIIDLELRPLPSPNSYPLEKRYTIPDHVHQALATMFAEWTMGPCFQRL